MERISDRFIAGAEGCTDLVQLKRLLGDVSLELGFHHYALVDHASLRDGSLGVLRIDNYPDGWVDERIEDCRLQDDPVHLACRRSNTGFCWSELGKLIRLRRGHKRIFKRSRRFGLGNGFTIPSNLPTEQSASCSFVVRRGLELPARRLSCTELVGAHALRALRRLQPKAPAQERPLLSPRERECLELIARGKTDWEIGCIFGISVETVHQYVKRARSAYGATNRAQLIVHALRDGWIPLDDDTPPNGGIG